MPRCILSLGRDTTLLETRKLLLESAGFAVTNETNVKGATHHCHQAALDPAHVYFDLILLCHTLSPSEVDTICEAVRQFIPAARTLRLRTTEDASYNPAIFLDRVEKAVSGHSKQHGAA